MYTRSAGSQGPVIQLPECILYAIHLLMEPASGKAGPGAIGHTGIPDLWPASAPCVKTYLQALATRD